MSVQTGVALQTKKNDYLNHLPMPNVSLVENESSKQIYLEAGYKNVKVMEKIYRFNYLANIKRKIIDNNQILIVPGLHDDSALLDQIFDDSYYT